ncbi:PAS domain S-box-containing protein [Rhizobium sp. RU20A]|uniref:PAS domain-containing protein n=1 Tax=Rhizobium sp. RU20A TaxID=1907412 RepID=UPI00095663B3|nr:PAS domain-containing protein [Rhizobium sp. RU20A]SIQ15652.1 PAS domain S-box-containing protein [Rhizobium sp. RU20A]
MRDLVDRFWLKHAQLQQAVESSNDALVDSLDRELDDLIKAIHEIEADGFEDARLQFEFFTSLMKAEAQDFACVTRNSELLSQLAQRYFDTDMAAKERYGIRLPETLRPNPLSQETYLNEAILDAMPDRIAVVTTDYRYLYSNPANAAYLDQRPMDLIGRHIVEFIGIQRFEQRVKAKLDACFAGEVVEYSFTKTQDGRTIVVRCRMTPCYSGAGKLIGAILILQETADRRRSIAA